MSGRRSNGVHTDWMPGSSGTTTSVSTSSTLVSSVWASPRPPSSFPTSSRLPSPPPPYPPAPVTAPALTPVPAPVPTRFTFVEESGCPVRPGPSTTSSFPSLPRVPPAYRLLAQEAWSAFSSLVSPTNSDLEWREVETAKSDDLSLFFAWHGSVYSIKIVGLVPAPVSVLYAALSDLSKRHEWDRTVKEIQVVDSEEPHIRVLYLAYYSQFLAQRRDFVSLEVRSGDPDAGTAALVYTSASHRDRPEREGYIRSAIRPSGWLLQPVGGARQSTRIVNIIQFEPGAPLNSPARAFFESDMHALRWAESFKAIRAMVEPPVPEGQVRSTDAHYALVSKCVFNDFLDMINCTSIDGWRPICTRNEVQIARKESLMYIRGMFLCDASAKDVWDLLCDVSRRKQWDILCHDAQCVEKIDEIHRILHSIMRPVVPGAPRDFCLLQTNHTGMNGAYAVTWCSVENPNVGIREDHVRSIFYPSGFLITPVAEHSCVITYGWQFHLDTWLPTYGNPSEEEIAPLHCGAMLAMAVSIRNTFSQARSSPPRCVPSVVDKSEECTPNNSTPPDSECLRADYLQVFGMLSRMLRAIAALSAENEYLRQQLEEKGTIVENLQESVTQLGRKRPPSKALKFINADPATTKKKKVEQSPPSGGTSDELMDEITGLIQSIGGTARYEQQLDGTESLDNEGVQLYNIYKMAQRLQRATGDLATLVDEPMPQEKAGDGLEHSRQE